MELLVWLQTRDAKRRAPRNKPKPFVPDFMQGEIARAGRAKNLEVKTTEEIDAILKRPRS